MTDGEILETMRAKQAWVARLEEKLDALRTEEAVLTEEIYSLWQEITRLHNALLHPDPTL